MLVKLPANPKRSELRAARRFIAPLALIDAQAAAELAAIEALIQARFPRRGMRSRRNALITPADCICGCPDCAGPMGMDERKLALGSGKLSRLPELAHLTCPACLGSGRRPQGTAAFLVDYGRLILVERGAYESPPLSEQSAQQPVIRPAGHERGFYHRAMIGSVAPARVDGWLTAPGVQPDAFDLSAEMEAEARAASVQHREEWTTDLGKKHLNKRNVRSLTPGQERRSMMWRRVRRLQAALHRLNNPVVREGGCKRPKIEDHLSILAELGVDPEIVAKAIQAAKCVERESETVAEARRRDDIGADGASERLRRLSDEMRYQLERRAIDHDGPVEVGKDGRHFGGIGLLSEKEYERRIFSLNRGYEKILAQAQA